MSIKKFLTIFAVSVFLIGTVATTNALAGGWKAPVADHEARIGDLETNDGDQDSQLGDHETSIGDVERKNTAQDGRLDTLEQNQTDLQTDVAAHEGRIQTLENQPAANGAVKVNDSSDPPQFIGILIELSHGWYGNYYTYIPRVFIPGINKFAQIVQTDIERNVMYFQGYGCNGPGYWRHGSTHISRFGSTYYTGGALIKAPDEEWLEWSAQHYGESCNDGQNPHYTPLYEPVVVPLADLPFILPLTLPFSFTAD